MRFKIIFILTYRKEPIETEFDARWSSLDEHLRKIAQYGLTVEGTWYPPHRIKEANIEVIK